MNRIKNRFHGLVELESRLAPSNTPPVLVRDILPGSLGSVPENTLVVGSKLFFTASDNGTGNELWISDGTSNGTNLVLDINTEFSGFGSSSPADLTEVNGRVFFSAFGSNASGRELWVSDGTAAGTKLVAEINPSGGSSPQGLVNVNGTLYFSAIDGVTGRELWSSDGTAAGTKLVADTLSGPNDGIAPGTFGANVGGVFFFAATDSDVGTELWTSSGTVTEPIQDLNPGKPSSSPFSIIEFNGKAAFVASVASVSNVFVSDGTSSGTVQLTSFTLDAVNADNLTNYNGVLVFRGLDPVAGSEPFTSDGTPAGTGLLRDIQPSGDSNPQNFSVVGNLLYFSADDGTAGHELWKTDGTSSGTVLVSDINPGMLSSYPTSITNVSGVAYFSANGTAGGYELWRSEGTNTTLIDVEVNTPSFPDSLAVMGSRLFFKASRSDVGNELFSLVEDNVAPTVTQINSPNPNGSYYTGSSVTVVLTFSEPVTLSGMGLQLTLDTGAVITVGAFTGTTATTTYIPGSGEFSSDLKVTGITLLGSSILTDAAGNAADLSLPTLNLDATKDIQVNLPLLPPVISAIPNQSANAGDTIGPVSFDISDPDSPSSSLSLSVVSSNPGLIPPGAVALIANGSSSTMTVVTQPGLGGVVTLTITVTDPDGNTATTNVLVTVNGPPSVNDIPDQTVLAGSTIGPLPFTIGDSETAPDSLILSVSSNNPSYIPPGNVTFGGTGANRTISISTPGIVGSAILTITVTDAGGLVATDSITVRTVLPPTISDTPDQTVLSGTVIGPLPITLANPSGSTIALILSVTSDNAAVPPSSVIFGGSGDNRTITISTTSGVAATTTLTVTVTDPGTLLTAADTIVVTQYTAPTISDIPDRTVNAGSLAGPIPFTIGGGLGSVNNLVLSVFSSNPAVIPTNAVTFGGSGANRTISVATLADISATTVLTVTVSDPASSLSTTDTLAITQVAGRPFAVSRGPGADSRLKVFNPDFTERLEFVPIEGFTNGLRSIMADFNGDGVDDIATGTRNFDGKTGTALSSRFAVFDGTTNARTFELEPFGSDFFNGLWLSAGDLNNDGRAELAVSAFFGGGSRIRIFSPNANGQFVQIADFFGLRDANDVADTTFQGGARTAIGDFNADGFGDLVYASGEGGGPRVAIYNGKTLGLNGGPKLLGDFFAMESNLRNGVHIAAGDINGDGRADLVVAPAEGGAPRVRIFSGGDLLKNQFAPFADFFGGSTASRNGLRIAVRNLDGDPLLDLLTGSGPTDGSRVAIFSGESLSPSVADDSALTGLTSSAALTSLAPDGPDFAFDAFPGSSHGVWVG